MVITDAWLVKSLIQLYNQCFPTIFPPAISLKKIITSVLTYTKENSVFWRKAEKTVLVIMFLGNWIMFYLVWYFNWCICKFISFNINVLKLWTHWSELYSKFQCREIKNTLFSSISFCVHAEYFSSWILKSSKGLF